MMRKNGKQGLTRDDSLAACPVQAEAEGKIVEGGKLCVTLRYNRPRWQRVLGGNRECRRTFRLDEFGREVYNQCDGRTSVGKIIRRFADKHHVNIAEAELSVVAFLKTMTSKGLIGMRIRQRQTAEGRTR